MTGQAKYRCRIPALSTALVCCLLSQVTLARQVATAEVSLGTTQSRMDRLGPDKPSGAATFVVDTCTTITVTIRSELATLDTFITSPSAVVINPLSVASLGGSFESQGVPAPSEDPDILILPQVDDVAFHRYVFPNLGPGTYTVAFSPTVPLVTNVAVAVVAEIDSPLVATLVVPHRELHQAFWSWEPPVLNAIVFDGEQPVSNLSPVAVVRALGGYEQSVTLSDNGQGVDLVATDGVYSGLVDDPTMPLGSYCVRCDIAGVTSTGLAFRRTVGADFSVVHQGAAFDPTLPYSTEQWVLTDTNGNGLYEASGVACFIRCRNTGTYRADVHLRSPSGGVVVASGERQIVASPGTHVIDAMVTAEQLRDLNLDGPYTITEAVLYSMEYDGAVEMDHLYARNDTSTIPGISTFEYPQLAVIRVLRETLIDPDQDGVKDGLAITMLVALRGVIAFDYSAELSDACGTLVQMLSGTASLGTSNDRTGGLVGMHSMPLTPVSIAAFPELAPILPSNQSLWEWTVEFEGSQIGTNGTDGPFRLHGMRQFTVAPVGMLDFQATTQAYAAELFAGYVPAPDCNNNNVPDTCDIREGTSADSNFDRIPDECQSLCLADFNEDGFVDGIDADLFTNAFDLGDLSADVNEDGFVDGIDSDLFMQRFEAGC